MSARFSTAWPVRGLYPRFELPPARAEPQDIYIKVLQFVPIRFSPQLKSVDESNMQMQYKLFVYGLVLGLLLLMAVFSLLLAASYRRYIYAWYSLYAACAFAAIASYVGVGTHILWPESTVWAERSVTICTLAAMASQLQFCRVMFLRDLATRWIDTAALASLAVSVGCIAGSFMLPLNAVESRLCLFFIGFTCCAVMLVLIIGSAVRLRDKVAWLWVLAFSPLLLLVCLTVLEGMGLVPLPDLPYDAVVYTMSYEALVLMFALQVHVKASHYLAVMAAAKNELGAWAAEDIEAKICPSEGSFCHFRIPISRYWVRKRRKMNRCGQFAADVPSAAQAPRPADRFSCAAAF